MKHLLPTLFLTLISLPAFAADKEKESDYERILRTKEIRCAYVVWPGHFEVDPNTGKKKGMMVDVMNAVAKELDVKVVWAEEVGWGNFAEGMRSNRYDMMCSSIWKSGQRAKIALLTRTLFYEGMYGFARADDKRFDKDVEAMNDPNVTITVIDGDITQAIRTGQFPKAKEMPVAASVDSGEYIMSVVAKKADVTFTSLEVAERYNKNAKEYAKLKIVTDGKPVRQFPNSMAVETGEHDLKAMLDSAIEALQVSGEMARIIKPYAENGVSPERAMQNHRN